MEYKKNTFYYKGDIVIYRGNKYELTCYDIYNIYCGSVCNVIPEGSRFWTKVKGD
jgi:hypothetical protein